MTTTELQEAIVRIINDIYETTADDDTRALGVARLCAVLLRKEFISQRLIIIEVLFNKLFLSRYKNPNPAILESERQLIRAILKLIEELEASDFDVFYNNITKSDDFLAEIFLLTNWSDNQGGERIQRLFEHLTATKIRILTTKEDIYTKEKYRYQNGLFMIREENNLKMLYDFMENKNCLLLMVLDLIKPFIPLNGYGYTIDGGDYDSLQKYGLI